MKKARPYSDAFSQKNIGVVEKSETLSKMKIDEPYKYLLFEPYSGPYNQPLYYCPLILKLVIVL